MGRILINFHNTPNIITRVKTRGPATLTIKEPYVGLAVLLRVASPARGSKIRASREAPSCSSHTVVGALFFWLIGPANLLRLAVHRQRPESSLSRFSWRRCSPLTVSCLLVHISSSPTYFIFAKQGLPRTQSTFISPLGHNENDQRMRVPSVAAAPAAMMTMMAASLLFSSSTMLVQAELTSAFRSDFDEVVSGVS